MMEATEYMAGAMEPIFYDILPQMMQQNTNGHTVALLNSLGISWYHRKGYGTDNPPPPLTRREKM